MKKILLFIAALLLAAPVLAQPSGGGPGPVPNPWLLNGAHVYYNQGCVSITTTVPGGCHGIGSLSVDTFWLNGSQITGVVSSVSFGTTGLTPSSPTAGAVVAAGTLSGANGGTSIAGSYAVGDLIYASAASAFSKLPDVATGNALISGGVTTAPSWGKIALTTHVSGLLPVANGGTGAATLTGVLKGTGTTAFVAATAGTDFVAPGTVTTFTAKQTFTGTSSNLSSALVNAVEPATISATAATGTINYDITTQSILYYTSNAAANWTINFRASSGTTLNAAMATGDVVTVVHMVTQGASPFFNNVYQVDGTTSGVSVKWQGGTAPSAGNASGIDVYTYSIVKTGSAAYTILGSQVQYK